MFQPTRASTVHGVAGIVVLLAALLEAGYGGRGAAYTAVTVASALLTGAAVAASRLLPVTAAVVLSAAMAAAHLSDPDGLPPLGGTQLIAYMLLVGNAAYRLPRSRSLVAYAVSATVPPLVIVAAGESLWEFVFFALILLPAWAVGFLLRREQRRAAELAALAAELARERERQAEVAVAAERTRISRELHDAVAHTVSVMTLQVGVVRRRQDPGSVEEETLRRAEGLGRQAVDELRRIVGIVREGESAELAPLPSLPLLDELVDEVRRTGTEVVLTVDGPVDDVPSAVGISTYRIVQEGLTNALRHAPGARVEVTVTITRGEVRVRVDDTGPSRSDLGTGAGTGTDVRTGVGTGVGIGGHGLAGLRERVHVLQGELTAGPLEGGGHRLEAVLPTGAAVAS